MATQPLDRKKSVRNQVTREEWQKRVDLAAPGVDIMSTRPVLSREQPPYGRYTGTSAAAALVTGAVALLRAQKPGLTPQQLKTCLRDTIDPLPRLKCVNGGRLNLGRALSWP